MEVMNRVFVDTINKVKMESLGWLLTRCDWNPYGKRKTCENTYKEKVIGWQRQRLTYLNPNECQGLYSEAQGVCP